MSQVTTQTKSYAVYQNIGVRENDQVAMDADRDIRFRGNWSTEYLLHYRKVAEVRAESLEQVFELCNLWEDSNLWTGENVYRGRVNKPYSLSVGDIVRQGTDWYLCESVGWRKII